MCCVVCSFVLNFLMFPFLFILLLDLYATSESKLRFDFEQLKYASRQRLELEHTAVKFLPIYADAIKEMKEKQSGNQANRILFKTDLPSNLMNSNFMDQVRVLMFSFISLVAIADV